MDPDFIAAAAAGIATAIIGWFGKKWKDEWEEKQIAKRAHPLEEEEHTHEAEDHHPQSGGHQHGRNGKTVSFEHCQAQMQIIGQRFDTVIGNQAEQRTDVQELTKAIFDWKDIAVEKLADHGARIGALERRAHGTRG